MTGAGVVKIRVKLSKPAKYSYFAIRPVSGFSSSRTPKKASRSDSNSGMPTTRTSTAMVGLSRMAAKRPWPSLRALRLTLVCGRVSTDANTAHVLVCHWGRVGRGGPAPGPPATVGRSALQQFLELGLQAVERRLRLLVTTDHAVGGILDRQRDVAVVGNLRARLGGLDRLLQHRQVRILPHQVRIVVDRCPRRRLRRLLRPRLHLLLRRHVVHEVDGGALVLSKGADGVVVATQAADARTVHTGQRGDAELAVHLRRPVVGVGQRVDV